MGQKTKIDYVDATQNFWRGCTAVSPGCDNCYARAWAERSGLEFDHLTRTKKSTFDAPLHWTPRRILTCSVSDFFHEEADQWRDDAWSIIKRTPFHKWLILTKRADRILANLPWKNKQDAWSNVLLGVTVENQDQSERIKHLLEVQAVCRFISVEPMLGPINLEPYLHYMDQECNVLDRIDWVIIGGESGRNSRPMKQEWVQDIILQCNHFGVPVWFKQWGGSDRLKGGNLIGDVEIHQLPEILSKAGRSGCELFDFLIQTDKIIPDKS